MRELDVGQRVKLTDRSWPHYGATGWVTGLDPDWGKAVVVGVDSDDFVNSSWSAASLLEPIEESAAIEPLAAALAEIDRLTVVLAAARPTSGG
jgi:hypothetical protein